MSLASELREKSDDQLAHELRETQQTLFRTRFHSASDRADGPAEVKRLRRTIARIKTIMRERELATAAS